MTEAEWLTSADPRPMLEFLRGKASERKLRLLGCAWCERVYPDSAERTALASRFADGLVTFDELRAVWKTTDSMPWSWPERGYDWASTQLPDSPYPMHRRLEPTEFDALVAFRHRLLHDLQDIFGNPVRPVAFDPRWRSEAAISLASALYADRAFDRLPVLADALEEAGCDHPDILNHCRGPGTHVRGCWVVDLVLGKS